MKVLFSSPAWAEYQQWIEKDPKTLKRINKLIKECRRNPFTGLGKPEPLKGDLSGWWSRRINQEDRLVYRVSGKGDQQELQIAQLKYHY